MKLSCKIQPFLMFTGTRMSSNQVRFKPMRRNALRGPRNFFTHFLASRNYDTNVPNAASGPRWMNILGTYLKLSVQDAMRSSSLLMKKFFKKTFTAATFSDQQ